MSQIERNSLVTIYYRLGLTNGDVLEDNFDDEPMTVQLGCGEMAEGLELALIGLREGEEETIDIGPDLAFGYVDDTLFRSIPLPVANPSALWCSTPYSRITSRFASDSSGIFSPSRSLWIAASSTVSLLSATTCTPWAASSCRFCL